MAEMECGDVEYAVVEACRSNRAAVFAGSGAQRSETQRRQIFRSANQALRRRTGVEERAVRRKAGDRFAIAEQAAQAICESERWPGALGGGNEHRPSAIPDDDPRTGTGQRAAIAAAETAQPFEAFLTARRQCRGKTKDLPRGNVRDLEMPPGTGDRAFRPKYCGADRVRPKNLRAVGAPGRLVAVEDEPVLEVEELALHLRAAKNNGVTREQIKEVLLQTAIYCGVPAANSAFHLADKLFREDDAAAAKP